MEIILKNKGVEFKIDLTQLVHIDEVMDKLLDMCYVAGFSEEVIEDCIIRLADELKECNNFCNMVNENYPEEEKVVCMPCALPKDQCCCEESSLPSLTKEFPECCSKEEFEDDEYVNTYCNLCNGTGKMLCSTCESTGLIDQKLSNVDKIVKVECNVCGGDKYLPCISCNGSGILTSKLENDNCIIKDYSTKETECKEFSFRKKD